MVVGPMQSVSEDNGCDMIGAAHCLKKALHLAGGHFSLGEHSHSYFILFSFGVETGVRFNQSAGQRDFVATQFRAPQTE